MKKTILLATFLLLSLNIVAQSKKEIIETLKIRIDSLHSEIKNRDINFEKAQAAANSNKEAMLKSISNLEQDITLLKGQLDVAQKNNDKLLENSMQLNTRVTVLKDSVTFLKNNLAAKVPLSTESDFDKKVKVAFEKLKSNEILSYWLDSISLEKDIIKDSYNEVCNDGGECISFVLTDQYLIVSYRANGPGPKEILIIDLNSGKNIINENESYVYVYGFDKEKSILKIETDGLDNNGRYWKDGTYNLKTKIRQLGKKEH